MHKQSRCTTSVLVFVNFLAICMRCFCLLQKLQSKETLLTGSLQALQQECSSAEIDREPAKQAQLAAGTAQVKLLPVLLQASQYGHPLKLYSTATSNDFMRACVCVCVCAPPGAPLALKIKHLPCLL